jgi:hypothetical protein
MFTTTPLSSRVDDRAVDRGAERPGRVAADAAAEDDLDVLRAAQVQVVSDQRLEERPGPARGVEDDGAGDLDLPHRALPPVPGIAVLACEGHGDPVQPPLGEHLDGARLEPVADLLQPGGVVAGREAVGQLSEADAGLECLPLGPLVAVDPDLGRVGEVGADLDERRAEVLVPQVEVVAGKDL